MACAQAQAEHALLAACLACNFEVLPPVFVYLTTRALLPAYTSVGHYELQLGWLPYLDKRAQFRGREVLPSILIVRAGADEAVQGKQRPYPWFRGYATEPGTKLVSPHLGEPRDLAFAQLHTATGTVLTRRH